MVWSISHINNSTNWQNNGKGNENRQSERLQVGWHGDVSRMVSDSMRCQENIKLTDIEIIRSNDDFCCHVFDCAILYIFAID